MCIEWRLINSLIVYYVDVFHFFSQPLSRYLALILFYFVFFLLAFTYIILMFLARIQYDIEWKANKIIKNECASVYALISSIGVCVSCIMVAGAAVNSIHFRFFCSYWGHNRWKYFSISFHQLEIKFFKHHHHHPRHWFFSVKNGFLCHFIQSLHCHFSRSDKFYYRKNRQAKKKICCFFGYFVEFRPLDWIKLFSEHNIFRPVYAACIRSNDDLNE